MKAKMIITAIKGLEESRDTEIEQFFRLFLLNALEVNLEPIFSPLKEGKMILQGAQSEKTKTWGILKASIAELGTLARQVRDLSFRLKDGILIPTPRSESMESSKSVPEKIESSIFQFLGEEIESIALILRDARENISNILDEI
jgi:hypothetical protein